MPVAGIGLDRLFMYLSGAQNTRFTARIYGVDSDALMAYVEDFSELGPSFHLPVRSYSSGMKARLGFAGPACVLEQCRRERRAS